MNLRTPALGRLAVAASAALLALAGATSARAAAGTWENVTQPIPGYGSGPGAGHSGVLAFGPDSVVVVEASYDGFCDAFPACAFPLTMTYWNGSTWTQKPAPPPFKGSADAVTGTSPDDVWAVGLPTLGAADAHHWDGQTWTERPFPSGFSYGGAVSVTAGEVLVAGSDWSQSPAQPAVPVVLRWDGSAWARTALPQPAGRSVRLEKIRQAGPGDLWVTGTIESADRTTSEFYVARFNGTTWTRMAAPTLPGGLYATDGEIAGTSTDLWLGGRDTGAGCSTAVHWNGSAFQTSKICGTDKTTSPLINTYAKYGGEWLVGLHSPGAAQRYDALRRWNGTSWVKTSPPLSATSIERLRTDPGGATLWTTGYSGSGFVARLSGPLPQ
ncbi:hypothetical protein [Streptomyces sp. NPDC060031]|uniref:hypothetical protein n=1 Tax=Streptomyces sp. NPDC060031 TaxID=3347043 RepID=UPI0036BB4C3C